MLQILLHTKDPSNRLYVLVLELNSYTFFKIKISSPQEIIDRSIERKYKSALKNAYMIFMTDCSEAFKTAKSEKKFRQNSEHFKDFSLLWNNSPKEVKDEYDRVYKMLKRNNFLQFVHYNPQNGNNEPITNSQISQPAAEDNSANDSISEATACNDGLNSYSAVNNVGNLFIDSLEENDANNLNNYSIVNNTENLITGTLGPLEENNTNNLNNYSIVNNTENLISSFGGNNANNLNNYSIVDNTGNLITETLGSFGENNTNNLNDYSMVDLTTETLESFGGNNTDNLNNYSIVDNTGNLISSFGGNNTNSLNYSIVDNGRNLINSYGENHMNNYQIVNNTGDLFIAENSLGSLGDNNVILETDDSLNNYQIVDNTGNLIISAIDNCLFEHGQDENNLNSQIY
ncbi:hypothetical protein RclHR1_00070026 [Rhizophagus clarus]|uniref:Uncharacterized protein n=1 Tax=Rhizophagus clarus TaxID=94130 RepID=A0A2Z6SK95_9GLOM|nr:hypothetical protein RclHR1_00070026 [Rhizophagus clarus]